MDILLCGSFDDNERDAWLAELQRALPQARWHLSATAENAGLITAAVVANPPAGLLQGLPNLRLIQSLWAGVDRLLSDPSLPDVPVARMVDLAMSAAMAETALWATLSLHRGFYDYARQQHACDWRQLPQRRADEIQVTLLGMGQMGRTCAQRLVTQGYRVTGWKLRSGAAEGRRAGARHGCPLAAAGMQRHCHQPAATDATDWRSAGPAFLRSSAPRRRAGQPRTGRAPGRG